VRKEEKKRGVKKKTAREFLFKSRSLSEPARTDELPRRRRALKQGGRKEEKPKN